MANNSNLLSYILQYKTAIMYISQLCIWQIIVWALTVCCTTSMPHLL